jgi:hypothetical protein
MSVDPPRVTPHDPDVPPDLAGQLLGIFGHASAEQLRAMNDASARILADTPTGDVESDADPADPLRGAAVKVAALVAGNLVVAGHLWLLLRALRRVGAPIPAAPFRACLGLVVGGGPVLRGAWLAARGKSLAGDEPWTS